MNRPRALALGRELIAIHHRLREQLDDIRAEVDGHADLLTRSRPSLHLHCLALCTAITSHHSAEDDTAFPTLAERFPDLGDVLTELEHDHRLIADLIRQFDALLASPTEPATVVAHVDGLAAVLDSHFGWEERRLVSALDQLDGSTSADQLFGT